MLLLSRARTEGTSEGGRERGWVQYGRERRGQIEMKIASFKQLSMLWALSPRATTYTKGTLSMHQGLMGKARGEVCPAPKHGLSWAATSCWRVPVSLATLCNIPHASSGIPNHILLTASESKYSMAFLCHARTRKTIILTAPCLWIVVLRQYKFPTSVCSRINGLRSITSPVCLQT